MTYIDILVVCFLVACYLKPRLKVKININL